MNFLELFAGLFLTIPGLISKPITQNESIATEIINITMPQERFKSITEESLKPKLERVYPILTDAQYKEISKELFQDCNKSFKEYKVNLINIFTETYSLKTLKDLLSFYKTESGQEYLKKSPNLAVRVMFETNNIQSKLYSDAFRKAQKMLNKSKKK